MATLTITQAQVAAARAARQSRKAIERGAAHVRNAGFDADRKVILLNKLLKAKEVGPEAVAALPKLVSLYEWMETVQALAIAGQTYFPAAPFTFEEVIAE